MNTDPIQRRKLYQEIEHRLLDRIRSGEIAPGQSTAWPCRTSTSS